jgi:PKD repeat protein
MANPRTPFRPLLTALERANWQNAELDNQFSSSAIGYTEGSATSSGIAGYSWDITTSSPTPPDYPVWGDTITWRRSTFSPGNEYMVVADSTNSTLTWNYNSLWKLGSNNVTPSPDTNTYFNGSNYPTVATGYVHGDLFIEGTPWEWVSKPIPSTEYTGITGNSIRWNTTNPRGRNVSLELFSAPAANISVHKYIIRIAGYLSDAEVASPNIFFNTPESNYTHRITVFLPIWGNDTSKPTPSELTVTGTGTAIKVISADTTKTDFIYRGIGTSSFDTYQTDGDTAIIRENVSGSVYSATVTNTTFLNKDGAELFTSSIKLKYLSTHTKVNGTQFNVSGTGSPTLTFYNITPPTSVKKDGDTLTEGVDWSISGTTLTISTTISDNVILFGNGGIFEVEETPEYTYETDTGMDTPTEIYYVTNTGEDIALRRQAVDEPFTTINNGVGVATSDVSSHSLIGLVGSYTPNQYSTNVRNGYCINTSGINDTANISQAWFSVYGTGKGNGVGSLSATITGFNPASTSLVTADYNKTDNNIYSQNISYNDWSSAGYNNFVFTNLTAINKVGYTCFIVRSTNDVDNSETGISYAAAGASFLTGYDYSANNIITQPKLSVIYDIPETVPPVAGISADPLTGSVPLTVSFSDLSTGATSWLWTFDGVNTSILKDPEWTFETVGTYNVNLTATNEFGSNSTYQDIVVTPGASPTSYFTISKTTVRVPGRITVNSTSTGSPLYHLWQWGDGTDGNTSANATHLFTKRGVFNISLSVDNGAGSSVAYQKVRVIGYDMFQSLTKYPEDIPYDPDIQKIVIILGLIVGGLLVFKRYKR